jgi:hypothetical protein
MSVQTLDHKVLGGCNRRGSAFAQKGEAPSTPQVNQYSDNNWNQTEESEGANSKREQLKM